MYLSSIGVLFSTPCGIHISLHAGGVISEVRQPDKSRWETLSIISDGPVLKASRPGVPMHMSSCYTRNLGKSTSDSRHPMEY